MVLYVIDFILSCLSGCRLIRSLIDCKKMSQHTRNKPAANPHDKALSSIFNGLVLLNTFYNIWNRHDRKLKTNLPTLSYNYQLPHAFIQVNSSHKIEWPLLCNRGLLRSSLKANREFKRDRFYLLLHLNTLYKCKCQQAEWISATKLNVKQDGVYYEKINYLSLCK